MLRQGEGETLQQAMQTAVNTLMLAQVQIYYALSPSYCIAICMVTSLLLHVRVCVRVAQQLLLRFHLEEYKIVGRANGALSKFHEDPQTVPQVTLNSVDALRNMLDLDLQVRSRDLHILYVFMRMPHLCPLPLSITA